MAEQLDWFKKWDKVLVQDFSDAKHQWFVGAGKLNVSYNCPRPSPHNPAQEQSRLYLGR